MLSITCACVASLIDLARKGVKGEGEKGERPELDSQFGGGDGELTELELATDSHTDKLEHALTN